ncbi:hypothetical protein NKG94_29040 [Micromonospora sp. M12]
MPEADTVQMRRSVVLDADAVAPVPKIEAVERYPVVVLDPDLRLGRWQAAVHQHQAQLTLLPTLGSRIGAWHEITGLTNTTQTIVPSNLDPQLLGPTGAHAETQIEQRHRIHPTQRPSQVHRASGCGRTGHSGQQQRITHRQHCLVDNHASNTRDALPAGTITCTSALRASPKACSWAPV